MAHDVFISYSSTDKSVADAVCATLESRAIACWIAPRDVLPGEEYAAALVRAVHDSRLMILVFSARANQSPQVLREVERAVSKGLTIIPFRIEDVPPTAAMEYYISSCHWLDALTGPLDRHLESLADSVAQLLARTGDGFPATRNPPTARPVARATRPPTKSSWWPMLAAAGGALMVAVLLLGYFVVNRTSTRAASQTSPMQQSSSAPAAPTAPPPAEPLIAASPAADTPAAGNDQRPPVPVSGSPRSLPPAPSNGTVVTKADRPKGTPTPASKSPECARLLERVSLGEADVLTAAEKTTVAQCGR